MPAATDSPPRTWLVPFLIALLCAIWGSTWWAIRLCLADGNQPPLSSAALRFVLAGLAMAAATPHLLRLDPKPAPSKWLWLATGTCSFAGSYGVLYVAEQVVPSGIAAVLWAIFPLLMAGSGVFVLGERLRPAQLGGFVVSFLGIVAVFAGDLGGDGTRDPHLLGSALLLLLSPCVSAIGTTLVKKFGQGTSSVLLNRNGMLFGALLLAVVAFTCESPLAMRWTLPTTVATIYLALFGTALTFGAYFWLLQRVAASRLALISYVTPVLAVVLGVLVGDGTADRWLWLGTALVVIGVALVVQKPRA